MAEQIGRYEIRRELGRGGMATVFLAFDPRFHRQVAIKVLPRQFTHDPHYLARFKQEAQTIATLEHPAIVPVYDFGEHDDAPYLVMRYMAGGSLRTRLSGEPLPLAEIVSVLERLGPALDYAHELGIIHRDLKPSNILFDHEDRSYLSDFGIARLAEASQTVTIIGTPAYMSPEQAESKVKLDGRSDIYAMGVILYELLTGKQPYVAETPTGQMLMHILEPVPDVLAANPALPPQAQGVIEKAMAKDRQLRYQTAADMAEAVTGLLAADMMPQPVAKSATAMEEPAAAPQVVPGDGSGGVEVPPADAGGNESGLPGWIWWTGALLLLAIGVVGIRAMFNNGNHGNSVNQAPASVDGEGVPSEEEVIVAVELVEATSTRRPTATTAPSATPTEEPSFTPTPVPTVTPTATPSPTPTELPKVPPLDAGLGDTWQRPVDGMMMVYVPQGSFLMGSETGNPDERPVHEVSLDAFWIDGTEVTNDQFAQFVALTDYVTQAEEQGGAWILSGGAWDFVAGADWRHPRGPDSNLLDLGDHPAAVVSWADAGAYCSWAEMRLPTEAEWEYAARGPESLEFPWGPVFDANQANFCDRNCPLEWANEDADDGYAYTSPVGSYTAGSSWVGALDLIGNVWEWVNDWYDENYYAKSPAQNPPGPASGEFKALRGGSWDNRLRGLRGSRRTVDTGEGGRHDVIGFRCAVSLGG